MIVLNELEFAEKMHNSGFVKRFCLFELSIYAKWQKYLGKSYDEIERVLIDFSKKYNKNFNYQLDFKIIDLALKSTDEYALRLPVVTTVTKTEWAVICGVDNEAYRRILFVMLVISKFYKANNTKINKNTSKVAPPDKSFDCHYCNESDLEYCRQAELGYVSVSDREKIFQDLKDLGLVDIKRGRTNTRFLTFVDENDRTAIEIKDYSHIVWYYDMLLGRNIGICKSCGRPFRQNKRNNAEYCREHRGYQKSNIKKIVCAGCNVAFEVSGNSKNKKWCNVCKKTRQLQLQRKSMEKIRSVK